MNLFGRKRVYLDYASAPPVHRSAQTAIQTAEKYYGNAGAIHSEGAESAAALSEARTRIAALLNVKPREIIFTSGLTESNNLAIIGFARALELKRRTLEGTHWIVSAIEHSSVLDCFAEIERMGARVSHIAPDSKGIFQPDSLMAILDAQTVFVSIGWGNNEIGTLQSMSKLRAVMTEAEKKYGIDILFHSDAGQAPLYSATTANSLGVDLLSLGGNKLYGPHGVGALYISTRADIVRTLFGGPQERRLRPGTENVALALGFAAAYESVAQEREKEGTRVGALRDMMVSELSKAIPAMAVNGSPAHAMPHMLNVSFPNISGEYLTLSLDRDGIAVSTKSACREGEESESHVVAALGGESWVAKNTIRISLGRETTTRDAHRAVQTIIRLVNSAQK